MAGANLSIRIDLRSGDRIGPGKIKLLEARTCSRSAFLAADWSIASAETERDAVDLHGLLPPNIGVLDEQLSRRLQVLRSFKTDLERYSFLSGLHDANETLFFALLERNIEELTFAAIGTAGQRCTTLRRLFVHDNVYERNVYERLVPRLSQIYASVKVGDPREAGTLVGPLIDRRAFESMQRALEEAREAGGILHGGERIAEIGGENAYYVRPGLCERLTPICSVTPAATSWRMTASIPARCRRTSATETSRTPHDTRRWHRIGLKVSGKIRARTH